MVRKVLILSAFSILLSANLVWGATFNVYNATDFQTALTTAQNNGEADQINVAAGDYMLSSTLTYLANAISTVENFPLVINGPGAGLAILNGLDSVQVMNISMNGITDTNGHITVRGLAFRNGSSASQGGGLYIAATDANITIEGAEFLENAASDEGGGVIATSGTGAIAITNSTFTGNESTTFRGGGAFVQSDGLVSITNSAFTGNTASNQGGGAYAFSWIGTIAITDSAFTNNTASRDGGGAYAYSDSGAAAISNSTFSSNNADAGAGAYTLTTNGDITMMNNTFSINNATSGSGGGAYASSATGGDMALDGNTFSGNSSSDNGGGLFAEAAAITSKLSVTNSVFKGNYTNTGYGGGVLADGELILVVNNFVHGNSADTGGGVYLVIYSGGSGTLSNNSISGNQARYDGAGAYADLVGSSITVDFYNNIIYANASQEGVGDDIHVLKGGAGSITTLDYNNYSILNSNGTGTITITNSLNTNPLYADSSDASSVNWNLHLKSYSPMVDAGNNSAAGISASTKDIDGDSRIVGGTVDIGADEYVAPVDGGGGAVASSGGGGGCFIATAAYGSYMDADVMVLREFRDDVLFKSKAGTVLVEAYYTYSPPVADFIASHPALRVATRIALEPVVASVKNPGLFIAGIFAFTGLIAIRRRR
jgi:hypothetical protein